MAAGTTGRRRRRALTTVAGIVIVAVMLFPVYWMLNAAFEPASALLKSPPQWFPTRGTLAGFRNAFSQQLGHLGISLEVALGTVALTLAVAAPAAYALAQLRIRGAGVIIFVVTLVQMFPGIVMANALYDTMSKLGLLNTQLALILADSTLAIPFAILVMRASMVNIPRALSEAAVVDGASLPRTFVSIILPVSRNAVITAGLFTFLFAWADFLFAVTLSTTGNVEPITVGIYRYIGANTTDWNSVMAASALAAIPAAILLIAAQRFIVAGVGSGSVKE